MIFGQLFLNALTLGGAIAVTVSYSENKSVGWAIVHGLFGWWYLLYRWVTK